MKLDNEDSRKERNMSYRICPYCGANLDPGERCDCKNEAESQTLGKKRKKAAPVLAHRSGRVEKVKSHNSTSILRNNQEDCQV